MEACEKMAEATFQENEFYAFLQMFWAFILNWKQEVLIYFYRVLPNQDKQT